MAGVSSMVASGSQPGVSYAAAASSITFPEVSHHSAVISHKSSSSWRPSSADDRSCNLILFGLLEGRSLVESKKVVDELFLVILSKSRICFI